MGHYSEHYAAQEYDALVRDHGPKELPALTKENLRYNIARANKAEAELRELKGALRTLKRAL
jgi:hypothetical protein